MSNQASLRLLAAALLVALAGLTGCAEEHESSRPDAAPHAAVATPTADAALTFAVVGDFGSGDSHERDVADLVASWKPEFVVSTGDNYYVTAGGEAAEKYDRSVAAFYGAWIKSPGNAFFPAMGNHDYSDVEPAPDTYTDYFDLPGAGYSNSSGNERYYDFVKGPIHFFMLNSNPEEPDGRDRGSKQAGWLEDQLAASTSVWNVVVLHHAPYSSDETHGSTDTLWWPYAKWGADVVIGGHSHTYERLERDDIVYFVNGLGGGERYSVAEPITGSTVRFDADWGAQQVTATPEQLIFEFMSVGGRVVDRRALKAPEKQ